MRILHIDGLRSMENAVGHSSEIILREMSNRLTLETGTVHAIKMTPDQADVLANKLRVMADRIRDATPPGPPEPPA